MPLIKCPDCGKEVSDRAAACIHCGCPLNEISIQNDCICEIDNISYDFSDYTL